MSWDRVLGLDLGADDYVVKPFSAIELGARVASVLRRSGTGATPVRAEGNQVSSAALTLPARDGHPARTVVVRLSERQVLVAGESVDLTPKEFDLLVCLASAPRRVFSRAELLEHVWGSALDWQDPSTVTEHVRRLRRKLEADPENPCWIRTVRGVGYRFDPDGRAAPPVVGPQP